MEDARIGATIRLLRQRRGWRQIDLAARSHVSQSAVSDMERGRVDRYTVATTRRVLLALGARASLDVVWGGRGDVERLLDADHAQLVEAWARRHRLAGWEVRPEASYSVYGERGRIDLLCFHPRSRVLEVVEAKTGIWEINETIGRLNAKARLAGRIAAEYRWTADRVVPALVVAEGRTARRRLSDHAASFAHLTARGAVARRFVRSPETVATGGLLAFVPLPHTTTKGLRRAGQRRVTRSSSTPRSSSRGTGT